MSKILVIDDSKMMSYCLHMWLEGAGFEVEEWIPPSAMEISDYIKGSAPDLILSDFQMPGCNGGTVARMALKVAPEIPVLILTAIHDKDIESNLLKLGVRKVIMKPIGAKDLVQAVKDALVTHSDKA